MKKYLLNLLLLFSFLHFSHAQVFVNPNASGANDGSSWLDAYTNLQDALANTEANEIWVTEGTYFPSMQDSAIYFLIAAQHSIYGGFDGTETDLSERDLSTNVTIINGDLNNDDDIQSPTLYRMDNAQHLFYIPEDFGIVTIDGFSFNGGNSLLEDNEEFNFYLRGGGIYTFSPISLSNCTFNNCVGRAGSSIYVSHSGTGTKITNSTFTNNYTTAQAPVMLANCVDPIVATCDFNNNVVTRGCLYTLYCNGAEIKDCSFKNNLGHPDNWGGVAFFNWNSINIAMQNCIFEENISTNNAAVWYCDGRELSNDETQMIVSSCAFNNNESPGFGGNLYFWRANYEMSGCLFTGNTAANGGVIYNGNTKFLVKFSEFEDNSADFGGTTLNYNGATEGEYLDCYFKNNQGNSSGGVAMVGFLASVDYTNCIFESNEALWGGCMYIQNDSSKVNINNCEFISNSSNNFGGALAAFGSHEININNCLFEANVSDFGGAVSVIDDSLNFGILTMDRNRFNFNLANTQGGGLNIVDYTTSIKTSLFTNNEASNLGNGGAISNNAANGRNADLSIYNTTIAENFGVFAAGISQYQDEDAEGVATLNLTNTILFNLAGGGDYAIEEGEPIVNSLGGNHCFDGDLFADFDGMNDLQGEDPLFVGIGQSDFNLLPESPAIDKGVEDGAHTMDLNGEPIVGIVDKGCFENQNPSFNFDLVDERVLKILNNPTRNFATAELNHPYKGKISISIEDIRGKKYQSFIVQKNDASLLVPLDLQNYPSGTYLVHIQMSNMVISKQLLKI